MTVTVFTRYSCAACKGTKTFLEEQGILFAEVNVEDDHDRAWELVEAGWRGMPVIHVEFEDGTEDWWSGNDPVKLRALTS